LASDLLEKYGNAISELKLIPSGGGVYEIEKDGKLVFSKKKLDRFPELEEIVQLID
jgi:selenoprotein W-related protein